MFKKFVSEVGLASRVVWLSGASSGLGRAAAEGFRRAGWQVVSGARSFEGRQGEGPMGCCLALDVTKEDSVAAFVEAALARSGPPDALVCAAGVITLGPAQTTSPEELCAVMDTNFLGAVRLVQAVLPHLQGRGAGKIALLSSVNGLMPTPYQGAYVASKHALEGWAECLMLETRGSGVQVMLVEPGDHQGGSARYRARAAVCTQDYRESFERVCHTIHRDESQGGQPQAFAKKLVRAMERKRLPARLRATTIKEYAAVVLHDLLPGRLFHRFLSGYYRV